ncbi:MAG: tetratricopeptide repeat protein [Spirochaetales bacterium]
MISAMHKLFGFLFLRYWERLALNHFVMGKYEKAEEYFRKIQEVQPNKMGIGHNIGLVCLAQERYEEAEKEFLKELNRYGETYIRLKTLGDLYYLWGRREECYKYYTAALPLCEQEPDRKLLEKRIAYASDAATFTKAMDSYRALKKGNAFMAEKSFESSYQEFERAVALDPYNFQAWNNMGALELNYRKNVAKAVELFQRAVEYTSLPAIHNNLKRAKAMLEKEKGK